MTHHRGQDLQWGKVPRIISQRCILPHKYMCGIILESSLYTLNSHYNCYLHIERLELGFCTYVTMVMTRALIMLPE